MGQGIIVSFFLVCTPYWGLDDIQKDHFFGLINVASKLELNETAVIVRDFSGHVGVAQKILRASMEVVVLELGIWKGKGFWSLVLT